MLSFRLEEALEHLSQDLAKRMKVSIPVTSPFLFQTSELVL